MARNVSQSITVNGWANLKTSIDKYNGESIIQGEATIVNMSATPCYVHFYDSPTTNPNSGISTAGTDGLPVCTDTAVAPSSAFTVPKGANIANIWLYTGSSISVKVSVYGG